MYVCHEKVTPSWIVDDDDFFPPRREARREKFTHQNCNLSTIHSRPSRPKAGLGLVVIMKVIWPNAE